MAGKTDQDGGGRKKRVALLRAVPSSCSILSPREWDVNGSLCPKEFRERK